MSLEKIVVSISVLILTKNEEQDLPGCLESVSWSDDIHVLDSYSTDRTVQIAEDRGCRVVQRIFDNWSAHQNWALANLRFKYEWVLYLDADERVSEKLSFSLRNAVRVTSASAFRIQRRDFFRDGTWLKYSQISPYFVRMFRPECVRYERLVNPVTIVRGETVGLEGYLDHYPFSKGISFWLKRHVRYAELEAETKMNGAIIPLGKCLMNSIFAKDFAVRRASQKAIFYRMPLRPIIKVIYMLLFRGSFLD